MGSALLTADFKKGFNFGFLCKKMLNADDSTQININDIIGKTVEIFDKPAFTHVTQKQLVYEPPEGYIDYASTRQRIEKQQCIAFLTDLLSPLRVSTQWAENVTVKGGNQKKGLLATFSSGSVLFISLEESPEGYINLYSTGFVTAASKENIADVSFGTGSYFNDCIAKVSDTQCTFTVYQCQYGEHGNLFLKAGSTERGTRSILCLADNGRYFGYNWGNGGYDTELKIAYYNSDNTLVDVTNTSTCYGVMAGDDTATGYAHRINAIVPPYTSSDDNARQHIFSMGLNAIDADDPQFARLLLGHYQYSRIFGIGDPENRKKFFAIKISNTISNTSSHNIIFPISDLIEY